MSQSRKLLYSDSHSYSHSNSHFRIYILTLTHSNNRTHSITPTNASIISLPHRSPHSSFSPRQHPHSLSPPTFLLYLRKYVMKVSREFLSNEPHQPLSREGLLRRTYLCKWENLRTIGQKTQRLERKFYNMQNVNTRKCIPKTMAG